MVNEDNEKNITDENNYWYPNSFKELFMDILMLVAVFIVASIICYMITVLFFI